METITQKAVPQMFMASKAACVSGTLKYTGARPVKNSWPQYRAMEFIPGMKNNDGTATTTKTVNNNDRGYFHLIR